jgi:hypothetical protein
MATAGTDPADYSTRVECRRTPPRRGVRRSGATFENLALFAGQRATCTFRNVLVGVLGLPAIAIRKTGPAIAEAGDTLGYTLFVTNPGDTPFPEAGVQVTDPDCDDPPALAEKRDASGEDDSPGTLDPGDTWVYRCSNRTADTGADCEPTRVANTGMVIGTEGETSVTDDDSISTVLLCPDRPPPPAPEPLGPPGPDRPEEPGVVVPPGPRPPNAGDAGIAAFLFRRATQGCISSRVPRIPMELTRISRIRVFIDGRLARRLTVRTLQTRVRPRVTLPPGRYRIAVRVRFQRGSGTPPLTLRGSFRICGRPSRPPRVTG